MKKLITAALAASFLAALTGASAGDAGTAADPLITKEYAEGAYARELDGRWAGLMDGALQPVYDMYAAAFGAEDEEYTFTSGQEHFFLASGGSFEAALGCGVTVLSGSVRVTYPSGCVIHIASGSQAASGDALVLGMRYFCAEDTKAVFEAETDAALMVDGPYRPVSGMERRDPEPPERRYADVAEGIWYDSAARYAREKRIFRDCDGELFRPNDGMTRVEIAYALWMAAGAPETDYVTSYDDAPEEFYMPAVNWVGELDIMHGVGDNMFGTGDILNRATVAVVLFRASGGGEGRAELEAFSDSGDVPFWAADAVSWGVANGVIHGFDDMTLGPLEPISRAQVATLLQRMYQDAELGSE